MVDSAAPAPFMTCITSTEWKFCAMLRLLKVLRRNLLWIAWLYRFEGNNTAIRTHKHHDEPKNNDAFYRKVIQNSNNTHVCTQEQSTAMHRHSHICLPWHLWIVFFLLFTSVSLDCCSGTRANTCLLDISTHRSRPASHLHSITLLWTSLSN